MSVKYSNEHEWIRVEGDVGTVGISQYAQEQLGDVVFVDVPQAGRKVAKGESVAVVELVKAASDIYAPVSGEVTEGNAALADAPGDVNADPMGKGWFFKIKLANPAELDGLMDRGGLRRFREEPLRTLMRYLPLTDADRREMLASIGAKSVDELFRDVPQSARLGGKVAGLPDHPGELEVERAFQAYAAKNVRRRIGAVLHRRRRLSPSCAGDRRLHDPARRVPDLLHAVPARDHARHAAVPVRVPDPGHAAHRHGGGQRLDVRRLDRRGRGGADGQPRDAPRTRR